MRTVFACMLAAASGLALAGLNIACSPFTEGLGGEPSAGDDPQDEADSGHVGGELGDESNDDSGDEYGDSNGDTLAEDDDDIPRDCEHFKPQKVAVIELDNLALGPDDCSEPIFQARVATSHPGFYGLYACDCELAPDCMGEMFELTVLVSDPAWRPALEVDSCQWFHVSSEEVEPGICRRNRVDISTTKQGAPWYSAGIAGEDLERHGLALTPITSDACTNSCGEWQHREVLVSTEDSEVRLDWDDVGTIGGYEVKLWQSYTTPAGCEAPAADVTIWTAR